MLVYGTAVGSKICDLGRAWDRNLASQFDACEVAGDRTYAPLEQLYGAPLLDHNTRRFGCDMYHLGSLLVFLFTRLHTNALVIDSLDVAQRPRFWGGTYAEILPTIQAAFDVALTTFSSHVPTNLRPDLERAVAELCNPDPARRGHPSNGGRNRFSLERYISLFDRLAHRARLHLA